MTISTDPTGPSATHAYLEAARSEFIGDPRTNLAAQIIEYANQARQDTRQQRLAEEEHRQALEARQVQAMRAEADLIRAAGYARGIAGIVGGALTATGGAVQVLGASSEAETPGEAQSQTSSEEGWSATLSGLGKVASSGGEFVGSHYDGEAGDARADQTAFGHRIDASERRRQALDEDAAEALELQRSGVDHLRNIANSEADGAQAAIFRG